LSFILNNFFINLRRAFKEDLPEYVFKFSEDEEENTGKLEVLYKIDQSGMAFVNAFSAILLKRFSHNPLEEFLMKVAQVSQAKDVKKIRK
jgi:hypothetical protein